MAGITGPISTMRGSRHVVPKDATCDECGEPATMRIQGETDSFGSEMYDSCQSCFDKEQEAARLAKEEDPEWGMLICDGCGCTAETKSARDLEEGMCGRVYEYCESCMSRHREQQRAAFADVDDHQDYWGEDED